QRVFSEEMECRWSLLLLLLLGSSALAKPGARSGDEECQQNVNCFLPDCLCASTENPGNLPLDQLPQFVVLTFDDAVTPTNYEFYLTFKDFLNPNYCRISMTFFVTHLYNYYDMVNELHRLGHEIALHSVTHKDDVDNYWRVANQSVWEHEMADLKTMLETYARIPAEDIKGWRAPFLEVGGDEMFSAITDLGLQYDCTWPTLHYTNWFDTEPLGALWPYTLDFPSIQDCQLGRCPTQIYEGTWVMPMVDLEDNTGQPCAMLDACNSLENELLVDPDAVESFLRRNFEYNYNSTKAPFGLYVHHSWFYEGGNSTDARRVGYTRFLEYLSKLEDVYVVSVDRLLAWVKNPVPLDDIDSIDEFGCYEPESNCVDTKIFKFTTENNLPVEVDAIYMGSCTLVQPKYYPWIYNPLGDQNITDV
ncbi:hypothetical protein OTU49_017270, partial [Cherax quadricarinatus]